MAPGNTLVVAFLFSSLQGLVCCAVMTQSSLLPTSVVTTDHQNASILVENPVLRGNVTTNEHIPKCILKPPDNPPVSLKSTVVRCSTPEVRKCLTLKKVLMNGKCYSVGTPGPCRENEIVVVDKKLCEESNILRGICSSFVARGGRILEEFMSYDQCCHSYLNITNYICPREKNLKVRKNMFGEGECEFLILENRTSSTNIGHEEELKGEECVVPDLSFSWDYNPFATQESLFPRLSARHPFANITVRCNEEERTCFAKEQVLVPRDTTGVTAGGCQTLLSLSPCPPGAWLVLDKNALEDEGRLLPVCKEPRCFPESVFLAKDQRCISLWELEHERCASERIVYDLFGEGHCVKFTSQAQMLRLPEHIQGDECELVETEPTEGIQLIVGGKFPRPPCPSSDSNKCSSSVVTFPSKPSTLAR